MLRRIFGMVAVVSLAAFVFATAASSAGPSTAGITVSCVDGGNTTVSGVKGNPVYFELSFQAGTQIFLNIGGKYGPSATYPTPAFNPGSVFWAVDYKSGAQRQGVVGCS